VDPSQTPNEGALDQKAQKSESEETLRLEAESKIQELSQQLANSMAMIDQVNQGFLPESLLPLFNWAF